MNDANLNEILVVKQRDSIVRLKAKVEELEAELTEQKIRSTIAEGENSKLRERNTQLNTELNTAKNSLFLCNKSKRAAAIRRIQAAIKDNHK